MHLDDAPAVATTKVVKERVGGPEDVASETAHYGDLKGANCLAAFLRCQHYSDTFVTRWTALAGEEMIRTGHGSHLDYNSEVANTALRHMWED